MSPNNIETLVLETGVREIHGSFSRKIPSRMKYRNTKVSMSATSSEEYSNSETDEEILMKALSNLHHILDQI